jgi:hypothetical protein
LRRGRQIFSSLRSLRCFAAILFLLASLREFFTGPSWREGLSKLTSPRFQAQIWDPSELPFV